MWYNESAKRHRPQEGSLHGKDNTGSIPPSTNDEVSGRARERNGDGDTVQDKQEDGNEMAEAVGWDNPELGGPKPQAQA